MSDGDVPVTPAESLHVAVVLPCRNEEVYLARTCASLGFGIGRQLSPSGALLFLIENDSSDRTLAIAQRIKADSEPGTVFVGYEPVRGYVPPRHRGNVMVRELANSRRWDPEGVLILQADADTRYLPGYVESMRKAAALGGPRVMIEACVAYPPEFKTQYAEYVQLCDNIDSAFDHLFPRDLSQDILVDDKVSGYRLADYLGWGGHLREYTAHGEEIHAETARLYMRARAVGASRLRAIDALAFHSPRRVLVNPALHLATAGFPREASWKARWLAGYGGPTNMTGLCAQAGHSEVLRALRVREEHILALLAGLPLHMDRALGEAPSFETADFADSVLPLLPQRTRDDLQSRPSIFLTDVFGLMEGHGDKLVEAARRLPLRKR